MPFLLKMRSFLRNIFLAHRVESDLDEKVRSHLEMLTEENIHSGMSPHEARRAARIELGGIDQLKEQVHQVQVTRECTTNCNKCFRVQLGATIDGINNHVARRMDILDPVTCLAASRLPSRAGR